MFKKIFLMILFVGVGLLIAGFVMTKGDFSMIGGAFLADEDYVAKEASGSEVIERVKFDLIDQDVTIYHSEDESYKVEYFESEYDLVHVSVEGTTLLIKGRHKNRIFFMNWKYKSSKVSSLTIYLPASFASEIEGSVTSGEINLDDFSLMKLDLDVTSGEVNVTNTTVENLFQADITSGSVTLKNITTKKARLEATSGEIEIINSTIQEELIVDITSGDLEVKSTFAKKVKASATSGEIVLINVETEEVDANVQSGDIEIVIKGESDDYEVDVDITSGSFYYLGKKERDRHLNRDGAYYLKLSATSGTIKVNFTN